MDMPEGFKTNGEILSRFLCHVMMYLAETQRLKENAYIVLLFLRNRLLDGLPGHLVMGVKRVHYQLLHVFMSSSTLPRFIH